MIIRFNENLQVEEIDAEESINAGNNLVNEIKVFMPSNFDFNIHKGYINFKLSDGKEYNNLVMERVKKENIQLVQEMCYYYVLPKFLTKQKGTIDLSVRISPISNTNVIANTGVIKAEINYAVFENGDEVLDPDTAEELRKDISESESALKLYVQETIEDGYDLRVIGTVDSINDLPKNLTFNDVGISYFVGITYPRDVYTWGYLNDMELGWSNQGPLKVLSDDPVLDFAKSEYEKSANKLYILDQTKTSSNVTLTVKNGVITLNGDTTNGYALFYLKFNADNVPLNKEVIFKNFSSSNYSGKINMNVGISGQQYFIQCGASGGNVQKRTFISPINQITIFINQGDTLDNVKFIPMISEVETDTFSEWNGEIIHEKDIEPVLLWENANLNTPFGEQTITLNESIANYKYIIVDVLGTYYGDKQCRNVEKFVSLIKEFEIILFGIYQNTSKSYSRNIYIGSDGKTCTVFRACGAGTATDSPCIPAKIYGSNY